MKKKSHSKKKKIKVIITEDQKIFRQALRSYFEEENLDVIAEAENGKVLLELLFVKKIKPDVVVLDLEMPIMDGGEALVEIRKVDKRLKIVMLTYIDNKDVIQEMKKNGVNAFLDKNNELDDVVDVIRQLYDEIEYTNIGGEIKPKFTKLEQEIISLILKSKTNSEIAELRKRTIKSIEAKRKNIYEKAGCRNLTEFILFCKSQGMLYIGREGGKPGDKEK